MKPEEIAQELLRRRGEERCRYYVPNGTLEKYIKLIGEGRHFVYILSAGNGVGKTAGLMNIMANIAWPGINREWFMGPIFESWPFPKRGRIVSESKNMEETGAIDEEIKAWWPKGRYQGSKNGKQYTSLYTTDTGWMFDKMSYEQEPKEFESATLGLAGFDEPPPKPIFDATVARMRKGGIILMPESPICESAQAQRDVSWIYEELVDSQDKDTVIVYGDSEDACIEHGVRGHLKHENLERMWAKWSKDTLLARKSGRPMHFANSILGRSFVREVHIIEDTAEPPAGSQFGMTVDPADGKPYAIGWWWVDPRGHIVFDYEWPEEDWVRVVKSRPPLPRMEQYLPIFRKYEAGRRMEWRIMDRHFGNNRNIRTGRTLIEDWSQDFGIDFSLSYDCENEMETGILKTLDYLAFDRERPLNAMNIPCLYMKRRCRNIIKSVENWARKVDPNTFVAGPDTKSPYKDFCDVVRYTCMARPQVYISRPILHRQAVYAVGR